MFAIYCNDQKLEKVEQYKLLGIVISEHFELSAYIRKTLKCMHYMKHGNSWVMNLTDSRLCNVIFKGLSKSQKPKK